MQIRVTRGRGWTTAEIQYENGVKLHAPNCRNHVCPVPHVLHPAHSGAIYIWHKIDMDKPSGCCSRKARHVAEAARAGRLAWASARFAASQNSCCATGTFSAWQSIRLQRDRVHTSSSGVHATSRNKG